MGVADVDDGRRAGGVRLFTRTPVTPRWIADRVLPAVRELQGRGARTLRLRRGWLGGPHVDVVAGDTPAGGWGAVAGSLDAGPATTGPLDPADYLEQARALGRLDAVPPPYLPMREHGAVEVLGTSDLAWGSARLDAFAGTAVVESTLCAPLIDTVDAVARDPQPATVLLAEAFVALGDAHQRGLAHGAPCFRTYAEAFLERWGPDRDLRSGFASRLATERPALEAVVEHCLAGDVSPRAAAWRSAFASSLAVVRRAAASGGLDVGGEDRADDTPAPADDVAMRLVIDLFHRQLPLLAVPTVQRYYLYYAVGELVGGLLANAGEVEVP